MITNFEENALLNNRAFKIVKDLELGYMARDIEGKYNYLPYLVSHALVVWQWHGQLTLHLNGHEVHSFSLYRDFKYGSIINSLKNDLQYAREKFNLNKDSDVEIKLTVYPVRSVFQIYDSKINEKSSDFDYNYKDKKSFLDLPFEKRDFSVLTNDNLGLDLSSVDKTGQEHVIFSSLSNDDDDIETNFELVKNAFLKEHGLRLVDRILTIEELIKEGE